jgi:transcriptional regulator with XRE-family HTH domain/mannose-6-phosphate isomerase-like protein (cupin superfamily)
MTQKRLIAVGEKLRAARNEQGLSLRELASRAGVSASLLSQIECGKVTPSASSLFQIATALALPIHAFFPQPETEETGSGKNQAENVGQISGVGRGKVAESRPTYATMDYRSLTGATPEPAETPSNAGPVVHAETRMVIELMDGLTWARLTPGVEEGMEFLEISFEPGCTTGSEMLYHAGREFGIVIEGEILMELGFERYTLKAGDSITFDSTRPHRVTNTSAGVTRTIWVRFTPDRTGRQAITQL